MHQLKVYEKKPQGRFCEVLLNLQDEQIRLL